MLKNSSSTLFRVLREGEEESDESVDYLDFEQSLVFHVIPIVSSERVVVITPRIFFENLAHGLFFV